MMKDYGVYHLTITSDHKNPRIPSREAVGTVTAGNEPSALRKAVKEFPAPMGATVEVEALDA